MARRRKQSPTAADPTGGFHPAFFDDEHHHEALEQLAVRALAADDVRSAFKFADRRCRIAPRAQAHHYTLRAEVLHRMRDRDAALADVRHALELLPEDIAANRRMLEWGDGAEQRRAAEVLLEREPNFKALIPAITALRKMTKRKAFAGIQQTDTQIIGWAAWSGRKSVELRIDCGGEIARIAIAAEPGHPLRPCLGHAARIAVARPTSQAAQIVTLSQGHKPFFEKRLPPIQRAALPIRSRTPSRVENSGDDPLTIIVPIYDDYEATKACLDSLLPELQSQRRVTAILVNDVSPDARIVKLVNGFARHDGVQLITNERNLGFVGSVNLALAKAAAGDVILLNADTVVPRGFAMRLRAAARSQPNIGTVVPLSNNGEFTSFPVPNIPNEMSPVDEIMAIDTVAATANADTLVDIPNGTGFCLYVTRECLNAIGILADIFESGYLEDADLCLRAREAGFRNVCAPSIYVGHAGTRSFGAQKRALVMRNMGRLEARFPDYRNECAMFVKADPLKGVRAAIEQQMPAVIAGAVLLVCGPGPSGAVAAARARELAAAGSKAILAELRPHSLYMAVHITDPSEGMPQSLAFALSPAAPRQELYRYLNGLRPSRVELIGPPVVPGEFFDLLQEFPRSKVTKLNTRKSAAPIALGAPAGSAHALGLLAMSAGASDHGLIETIARMMESKRAGAAIAVIGKTLNDLELLKIPNVSVSGAIDPDEIEDVLQHYGVKALVVATQQPLSGHPLINAVMASSFPVACFDGSSGRQAAKRDNLLIDPAMSKLNAAKAIRTWFDHL